MLHRGTSSCERGQQRPVPTSANGAAALHVRKPVARSSASASCQRPRLPTLEAPLPRGEIRGEAAAAAWALPVPRLGDLTTAPRRTAAFATLPSAASTASASSSTGAASFTCTRDAAAAAAAASAAAWRAKQAKELLPQRVVVAAIATRIAAAARGHRGVRRALRRMVARKQAARTGQADQEPSLAPSPPRAPVPRRLASRPRGEERSTVAASAVTEARWHGTGAAPRRPTAQAATLRDAADPATGCGHGMPRREWVGPTTAFARRRTAVSHGGMAPPPRRR